MNALFAAGGVQQLKGVPNISSLSDTKGHDKGHNAQSGLHGGLSRSGPSIAAGPPPPFPTHDLVKFYLQKVVAWSLVKGVN